MPPGARGAEATVERVLTAVECVPEGRVVSYGDVAALVGTGPRVVGAVLARHGAGVPWWRVTDASGRLAPHLRDEAIARWRVEGVSVRPDGTGCRIVAHRADLVVLARAYDERLPRELRDGDAP